MTTVTAPQTLPCEPAGRRRDESCVTNYANPGGRGDWRCSYSDAVDRFCQDVACGKVAAPNVPITCVNTDNGVSIACYDPTTKQKLSGPWSGHPPTANGCGLAHGPGCC